ncbi:hypothetical protein GCM10009093_09530 [Brevundimonas terrae]|uniref:Uncharacterized protein n=1 Tax=Brevundimonas terrae TaxID=363631 RepID=A0ABN0Y6A6_9CAUL|nr:hypothetical protein [Brevundimonas terrae]NIJ25490.1 hypothetical protein [Brevundimonas terrae]
MVFLVLLASATVANPLCTKALEVAPDLHCAPATYGVALAPSAEHAANLARNARDAEGRFATHFALPIAPYVVFSIPPVPPRQALNAAGFHTVLPWPAPQAIDGSIRERVTAQTREFAAGMNMSAEQTEQVIARALSQLPTPESLAAIDAGMMPHELGHLWTHQAFWSASDHAQDENTPRHYGSPAPDWLDEAAGILLEDAPTANQRRAHFKTLMAGGFVPAVGANDGAPFLLDLEGLLSRQHPGLDRAAPALVQARQSGGVAVSFTPASQTASGPPNGKETLFYIQIRAFADFLIQTSGRPTIIADITKAISQGQTFENWLATQGPAHNLPASIPALQQAWAAYAT